MPQTTVSSWLGRDAAKVEPKRAAAEAASETAPATEVDRRAQPMPASIPKQTPAAARSSTPPATRRTTRPARRYTPSERAEVLEHAAAHGVSAAHKRGAREVPREPPHGLRVAAQAREGIELKGQGPSLTSGPAPSEIEVQRDREILGEWRKHPGLGPSQIRNQLRRRGIKVSTPTARHVMQDAGYRPPKVKREPHDERFEAVRPNHLWHLDFVHQHIHRASTFTLILIDDGARFVTGHGVDDAERSEMAIRTFEGAVGRHGKPERVMLDRGAAFWSWGGISRFTALLDEMAVEQVVAVEKEHNGKVEVFNANLHKELFDRHRFYDLAEMMTRSRP